MANNKQRYINTRFWNDNYIAGLDPIEKLLFVYFLTNEHTNISGIYELPFKIMAIETGIDESMFKKILPRMKDKIRYIDGMVVIKNFVKHQETASPNVQKGILNCLKDLNIEFLKTIIKQGYYILPTYHMDTLCIPYVEGRNYLDSNLDSNSNLHLDATPVAKVKSIPHLKAKTTENPAFDLFWEAYPRKVGKITARESFDKIPKNLHGAVMAALEKQKAAGMASEEKYILHPSTWLNQSRWEDSVVESKFTPMELYAMECVKKWPLDESDNAMFMFARKYSDAELLKVRHIIKL